MFLFTLACVLVPDDAHDERLDADGDGVPYPDDCAPGDPSVTIPIWYADEDNDGHGDADVTKAACKQPVGFVAAGDDCNDADSAISPSETERCDGGVDEDCDGDVDDNDAGPLVDTTAFYADADTDGFGDPSRRVDACTAPAGHVKETLATDCNDDDDTVNPGVAEICDNGIDDDCDGGPHPCVPFGSHLLRDVAATRILGVEALERAGRGVYPVGDIDGDGRTDLAVTNYRYGFESGRAYVLASPFPDGDLDVDRDIRIDGVADYAGLGRFATGADTDGNGFDELYLAEGYGVASTIEPGRILGFPGPLTSGVIDRSAATVELVADNFQEITALQSVDSDDDANLDLVVGSLRLTGELWLLRGPVASGDLSTVADVQIRTAPGFSFDGVGVANLGDSDGDGIDDLFLADEEGDIVYVVPTDLPAGSLAVTDVGAAAIDATGRTIYSTAAPGDVDGDGLVDGLMSSVPINGQAFLVATHLDQDVTEAMASFDAAVSTDNLEAVAGGDLNGDGFGDVVLGAAAGSTTGQAYIFYGPVSGHHVTTDADAVLSGVDPGDFAGLQLIVPGDLDEDGFDDLVVGAMQTDETATDAGVTYLIRGGTL